MGGGNPIKSGSGAVSDAWHSNAAQTVVPIVAAYYTGGAVGGSSLAGGSSIGGAAAVGAEAGAAGAVAATVTADGMPTPEKSGDMPLAPPDLATVNDPAAVDRALRHKQRVAAAAGRGSTFLTGSQGLGNSGTGGGKTLLGM